MPKFKLLYFKNLLDIVFNKFFELYGDRFIKQQDEYVLASNFNKSKIVKIFRELVVQELKKNIVEYNILHPEYYVIIGACMPNDNILLKFNDNSAFPKKLLKLLNSRYQLKYVLKEKDIKIDIIKFNEACIDVFNMFFAKNSVEKYFGKEFKKNVVFIQHNKLDCYSMFKVLKTILGKANCINLHDELYKDFHSPIVAINDIIDKYANKTKANTNQEFKRIIDEIKLYLKELINYGN